MKKLIFILIFWTIPGLSHAGNLVDIYKTGTLKLIADPTFAINTDWDTLFSDYFSEKYNNPIGTYKDMVISDDGDIFISNYSQYNIYKFDYNGNYITRFGEERRERGYFYNRPSLDCILDNQYLITNENNGRMNFFDLNGNFNRLIEIDYGVDNCIALNDHMIALIGYVPYSGMQSRHVITLKDINTGDEKYISSYMYDWSDLFVAQFKTERGGTYVVEKPFSRFDHFIAKSLDNNIIEGYSNSPEIIIYSSEGEEINRFNVKANRLLITQKDKEEYWETTEKSIRQFDYLIEQNIPEKVKPIIQSPDFFPEYMPYYYYNLMTDSDGNILIFVYTNVPDTQKFQVYSPEGEYICETVIDPGIYDIDINSRFKNFVFHQGDLYCLAALKESSGIPLRLIKVNLSGVARITDEGENIELVSNGETGLWSGNASKQLRIEEVQSINVNQEDNDCIFSNISDVAIARNGDLYVCDYNEPRIKVFNQNGMFIRKFGKKGDGNDELLNNLLIETDGQNQLYIFNNIRNPRISIFDLTGNFIDRIELPAYSYCDEIKINPTGEIITVLGDDPVMSDSDISNYIYHFDHEGNIINSYSPKDFIYEMQWEFKDRDEPYPYPLYSSLHMDLSPDGDLYCALNYPYLIKIYRDGQLVKMIHREHINFTDAKWQYQYGLLTTKGSIQRIFCLHDSKFFLLRRDLIEDSTEINYFIDLFDSEGHFLKSYPYDEDKYGEIVHMDSEDYVYTRSKDDILRLVKYRFLFE